MKRQRIFRVLAALAGLCTVVAIGLTPKLRAQQPRQAQLVAVQVLGTTSKLRDFVPSLHEEPNAPFKIFPFRVPPQASNKPGSGGNRGGGGGGTSWTDPVLQTSTSGIASNYTLAGTSFDGIGENGYVPSDANLSVGNCAVSDCGGTVPTEQIVEIANVEYAIYGSSGNVLLPPAPIHTIFNGFTTSMCSTVDGGDPIALFDAIDQRWIISQLAYPSSLNDNHLCIAISVTSDAARSYNLYDLAFGVDFPDYPKLAVWSDGGSYAGIYLSTNIFYGGSIFVGAAGCAIPLSIVTNPPASGSSTAIPCFGPDSAAYNLLPAGLEGASFAPLGTPGLYLQFVNSGGASGSTLNLYRFQWSGSSGTLLGPTAISVPEFHEACGGGACVPQYGTREKLDSLGDRLMYRLSYLGTYDQMVVNHSVQISSSTNQTGVRWYAIQHPGGTPTVSDAGTFAPTTSYGWMGSIAQDKNGDLGLGYSTSSSSAHPGLAVTGRIPSDSVNELEPETQVFTGAGSQTSINRWGDYTSTSVAPDGCTFWYVNQYINSSGSWQTRIANFKFTSCVP
jgi:hypothetical protein